MALVSLARAPLSEGESGLEPAPVIDGQVPARHRDGLGRFGKRRGVDGLQHRFHRFMPERRIDQTSDFRKCSKKKSSRTLAHDPEIVAEMLDRFGARPSVRPR